jgi:hypothetical protein
MVLTEYARLKDHVVSMTGGLEAKVYEGGKKDASKADARSRC